LSNYGRGVISERGPAPAPNQQEHKFVNNKCQILISLSSHVIEKERQLLRHYH